MLAIFIFAFIPLAYIFGVIQFSDPKVLIAVFALCVFSLIGALAGAFKVDEQVTKSENLKLQGERQIRIFMDRIHDGVFQVDATGKILQINRSMAHFLGYDTASLLGRNLWEFLSFHDGPPDITFVPPGQERRSLLVPAKVNGGGQVELLVDLYRRDEGTQWSGFIGCAHAVRRALIPEKLREKAALAVCLRLRDALQNYIRDAAATIVTSHENPAAAFAALEDKTRQFSDSLGVYLEAKTVKSWRPKLSMQTIHPDELMEWLWARYQMPAHLRQRKLNFSCPQKPAPFLADFHYLSAMLAILIENAFKYTPLDGEINVTFRGTDQEVQFSVSDNGAGMRSDEASQASSPFFKAENGVNAQGESLGLGLWLAHRIAEAHQGLLTVEADPGKGSVFTFLMPRKVEEQTSAQNPAAPSPAAQNPAA